MTRYLNIDLDTTLGGVSPSDDLVSSQKAVKTYVDGVIPSQSGNSGKFLTTDGSSVSWEGISITDDIDNSTITVNSSDKIQAVATVNANTATGATSPIYDWVGTLAEYEDQNIATNHPTWLCYITDDYKITNVVCNNHNVGDIFFTMRKDDALNGAVPCDGSTYSTTEYTGSQAIGTLLANGKLPYVSLSDYATLLSTNGSVGVFGWDGGSATAFRVPSLTDIFVESGTAAQIGDYLAPGLPNITGILDPGDRRFNTSGVSGCFYATTAEANTYTNQVTTTTNQIVGFDASRSNSIYGNSTTVQPNTVRYRAMVQLSTGFTDEAYSTCSSVQADVTAMKAHEVIEFQAPTAANNYTWYRKYADGWVEQGGFVTGNSTFAIATVIFPVQMANKYYCLVLTSDAAQNEFTNTNQASQRGNSKAFSFNRSVYGFGCQSHNDVTWMVCGMYA